MGPGANQLLNTDSQVIFSNINIANDLSLNGRLYVTGTAKIDNDFYVGGNVYLNTTTSLQSQIYNLNQIIIDLSNQVNTLNNKTVVFTNALNGIYTFFFGTDMNTMPMR